MMSTDGEPVPTESDTEEPAAPEWGAPRPQGAWSGLSETLDENQLEAKKDQEENIQQAYKKGFAEGEASVEEPRRVYAEAAARLTATLDRLYAQVEEDVVALAEHIARNVVVVDSEARKRFVQKMAREAITLMRKCQRVNLAVHPDDVEALYSAMEPVPEHLSVEEDPTLTLGGFRVEGDAGRFDADLAKRLDEMGKGLEQGVQRYLARGEGT